MAAPHSPAPRRMGHVRHLTIDMPCMLSWDTVVWQSSVSMCEVDASISHHTSGSSEVGPKMVSLRMHRMCLLIAPVIAPDQHRSAIHPHTHCRGCLHVVDSSDQAHV